MKIAICEDEEIIRNEIKNMLMEYDRTFKISTFSSGELLLDTQEKFDIVYMDIQMDGIDGYSTAKEINKQGITRYLVFITSHDEFMEDAFKVRAYRFLKKPVKKEKLYESIESAVNEIQSVKTIRYNEKGTTRAIFIDDIIFIEALGDGTCIHLANEVILSSSSLKYWEDMLVGHDFYRISKSYLVSMRYVNSITDGNVKINKCKQVLQVPRRNLTEFKQAFYEYIEKNSSVIGE